MNVTLTVVAMALVVVDTKVLAEMSDGSIVELSCPWGAPDEAQINLRYGWKYRTAAELIELARSHNAGRKAECGVRLHEEKLRLYGHGYRSRGY